ncbi:cohesin domain-containing protein [Pseudoduganella flava]|uniref:General secretion pathway protein GspD n=2 Tax=Pseudoduganella flava TaxID=871742 RepID=A0ABX6FWW8_9BURK|nr:cohesin domain-containing protein [Pseudoduganella flava]QGZ41359.1 general secretion pathway protein GspD [Pseudoduganella flava]
MKHWLNIAACGAAALLLASCAGSRLHNAGLQSVEQGKLEEGIEQLQRAVQEEPGNARFKSDLLTRKSFAIDTLLQQADTAHSQARVGDAEAFYRRVQALDPRNPRAAAGLDMLLRERSHPNMLAEAETSLQAGDSERALGLVRNVLHENPSNPSALGLRQRIEAAQTQTRLVEPMLRVGQTPPINLEFRDATLKLVFDALARASGVNFVMDKDVRTDARTTIFLRQATLEDAIDFILQTNKLEKKVLNRNSMLIYPSTPDKLKDYQELVLKGFYLSNADAKQTQALLKAMLKSKDTFVDEKLNLLVMRDTPDAVRLAEKVIAMHDLAEPEVMLEVEVLEIKRSRLLELGVQWPNQLVLSPLGVGTGTTLADLRNLNSERISANIGSTAINLRRSVGDANILANPRIRARNKEKAKIMIGDKVPVSTSTTTATGVVSESVQYLDVGIKLDVEPTVYLRDEIAIKIGLEVSSISSEVKTPAGSLAYQIGSRSASTVLRLKDGETQVLAGLINDEDRMSASRVPGLGDMPLVGRLFGSQKDDRNKTEIVLSITPHLVRNVVKPDAGASEFWSGTESSLRTHPLTMQILEAKNVLDQPGRSPNEATQMRGPAVSAISVAPVIKADPSEIVLRTLAPSEVNVGEQFKVVVEMRADGEVRSLPFQLGFDPAAFQVLNVSEGTYFRQNEGQSTISSNIDSSAGKVLVSVVRNGEGGVPGDHSVAVVTMRALAAKPAAEIRLLSAAPITGGSATVVPVLPAPITVRIGE